MTPKEFQEKSLPIMDMATQNNWSLTSRDNKTFRLSFIDESSIVDLNIYLSKMTVCILPKLGSPTYLKRQSLQDVEKVIKNPYKYL